MLISGLIYGQSKRTDTVFVYNSGGKLVYDRPVHKKRIREVLKSLPEGYYFTETKRDTLIGGVRFYERCPADNFKPKFIKT